uniref:Uncharacterized protein n=1 Tax=viral metagenome TaxID=1070528 RepID=A0A6C0KWK7_9ZZZZ
MSSGSGYTVSGVDLDAIFALGSGATATGYLLSDGSDLSSRYLKNTSGVYAPDTGYTTTLNGYTGTDLSDIYEPLLFKYTGGTLSYQVTINEKVYNYCIEYNENNTKENYSSYITFYKNVSVNLFMCSPGGSSGYTVTPTYTGPGGGGGGGIIDTSNVSLSKDVEYSVYFGTHNYPNSIFSNPSSNMFIVTAGAPGYNSNSGISGYSGTGQFGISVNTNPFYAPPYNKYTSGSAATYPPDYLLGYGAGGASGSGNYGTPGGGSDGDGKGGLGYTFNGTVYATGGSGNYYSSNPESGYGFGGTPILNGDGTYTSGSGYNGRIFLYFNYPT